MEPINSPPDAHYANSARNAVITWRILNWRYA